jgi:hypothetical protein
MLQQGDVTVQASQLPNRVILPMGTLETFDAIETKLKYQYCKYNCKILHMTYYLLKLIT